MINYGIVGIGGFAAVWVRSLQSLEQKDIARLAAAVVRNPAKYAGQVADLKARGCVIYDSFERMLAEGRGQLDIIGAPTGIGTHEPLAVQAMQAGYNVLIEKPVAGTVQEVARLREVEKSTVRWCAVGYQWIYTPTLRWIKDKLASGRLGALREGRTMIGWPRASSYYARNGWAGQLRDNDRWILDGPATNGTSHYLTNMLYLAMAQQGAGAEVASVRAELYRAKPIPSYDTSCIEVHLASGTRLLHYSSHSLTENYDPVTTLYCEKGTIEWSGREDVVVARYADGSEERYANPDPAYNHTRALDQVARVAAGEEPAPLCGLVEGGPHVLCMNLAFESSVGVFSIPQEHIYTRTANDGTALIGIVGMEEILKQAYVTGAMFSELAPSWGKRTQPYAAEGYTRFPRSQALADWLSKAI